MALNLSIIIPAYNEASRIEATLRAIQTYLKDTSYELIVVDDGSQDATVAVLEKFPNIKLIKNEKNRGKGYSVKRGMLAASGEYKLFMDADHSVKINNLEKFLNEARSGADIVIASIEMPGSTIRDNNHGYRRIFGKWSKWLIRAVATPGIYDTQRGFKLFTAHSADIIFPKLTIDRWGFDIEILVIAQKNNLKIKEVAVDWMNSRTSSVRFISYVDTFFELLKIKMNSWKRIYE